jgi:hypothetical protein
MLVAQPSVEQQRAKRLALTHARTNKYKNRAPAGGAAAAAPEKGALVGPSAPTSTSTRWALVTP